MDLFSSLTEDGLFFAVFPGGFSFVLASHESASNMRLASN